MDLDSDGPRIEDYLPRSLDNLRNLSNFTKICLYFRSDIVSMQFAGPNGQVLITAMAASADANRSVAQSLAVLDISKTKWLEIIGSKPLSKGIHQALLSMQNLWTLTLSLCKDLRTFILALAPNLTNPMACPKLEDLTFRTEERFNIKTMVGVAAARASAGSPLRSIHIINCGELVRSEGKIELLRHVSHVETSFEISDVDFGVGDHCDLDYGDGDSSDEEGWEGGSSGDDSSIP